MRSTVRWEGPLGVEVSSVFLWVSCPSHHSDHSRGHRGRRGEAGRGRGERVCSCLSDK